VWYTFSLHAQSSVWLARSVAQHDITTTNRQSNHVDLFNFDNGSKLARRYSDHTA
jgi:hypothetical protein